MREKKNKERWDRRGGVGEKERKVTKILCF